MTPLKRWIVRRSNFPFSVPGKQIGTVAAPTRDKAEEVAGRLFAGAIVVEPGHASEKLERALARMASLAKRRTRAAALAIALSLVGVRPTFAQTARDSAHVKALRVSLDSLVKFAKTSSAPGYLKRAVSSVVAAEATLVAAPVVTPKPTPTPTPTPNSIGPAKLAVLPRAVESSTTPAPSRRVKVCATCNLQAAIDAAVSGDELLLAPGATYVGNFVLPNKGAAQSWITIRTDTVIPAGRVTPSAATALRLAAIKTTSNMAAVSTAVGAHHWRLAGLVIGGTPTASNITGLIRFGDGGTAETALALVAHHFILDRAYVHGEPTQDVRRCIALNSGETAIIDSWIADCHSLNGDSQAIAGWNGPGPFLIRNNRLEAGHEIVMFGGADPAIPNLIPSDITLAGNHIIRPMSWRGVWQAKNLIETKNAVRFLVEGNVIENVWADAQAGFAFVLKSENQTGTAPWTQTADVTIRYNVINSATEGITISATQGGNRAVPAARFTIHDNVIGAFLPGGDGKNLQLMGPVEDVSVFHNTFASAGTSTVVFGDDPTTPAVRATLHSNIFRNSTFGVKGNSTAGGTASITRWMPGGLWASNAIVGADCAYYPAYTHCTLATPLQLGLDGRAIGADLAKVAAATTGVVIAP